MTKSDILSESEEARLSIRGEPADFFRGEAAALDFAIEIVQGLRPRSRNAAKALELRLTPEQARHIESALGNGAMDRLIRAKLTKARNEYYGD